MAKWLTKSDYLKYLVHPAYLWLQKYDKDRLPPFDDNTMAVMAQGNEVEAYARQLFADGATVESLFTDAVHDTEQFVARNKTTIFQATVLTRRNLFAMADVIVKQADGSWDMFEVKSATRAKDVYLADLAFQKIAFEEGGYRIGRSHLVYINSHYVRNGVIDPDGLFTVRNVTTEVSEILDQTRLGIDDALAVMALPTCPDLDPLEARNFYDWREIYRYLNPDLPVDSIFNLCRLDGKLYRALADRHITRIQDVPTGIDLKSQQLTQIAVTKSGTPKVHRLKIAHWVEKLAYPIWFLDYETTFPAIPAYDGIRPYQQVPFQYSLDVRRSPDAELEHFEFLARDDQNPMPELLNQLSNDLGEAGSVIVWNKAFEMGVNDAMAILYPQFAEFLGGVNRRVRDLMDIFGNGWYADAGFLGSASIKKVLPVLVPELSYKTLGIQEGQMASTKWAQAAFGKIPPAEAEQIFRDLIAYCGQDTLAMVKILDVVMAIASELPQQTDLLAGL